MPFQHRAPSALSLNMNMNMEPSSPFHHNAPSPAHSLNMNTESSSTFPSRTQLSTSRFPTGDTSAVKTKKLSSSFYVGSTLVDNGVQSYMQGRYDQALKQFSTALKTQRLTLGNDHICIAHTLGNIGAVLLKQERFQDASGVLKESLLIKNALRLKPNTVLPHSVTVIKISDTLNNLGNAAFLDGKFQDAMSYYQDSLKEITTGEIPGSVIEIADCLHNIGNIHCFLYELDEALLAHTESLQLIQTANGQDDLNAVDTMEKIGSIYLSQHRYDDAMATFVEVLRVTRAALGYHHVDCAPSIYNIGMTYEANGDRRKAKESYLTALSIYQQNDVDDQSVEVVRQRMVKI